MFEKLKSILGIGYDAPNFDARPVAIEALSSSLPSDPMPTKFVPRQAQSVPSYLSTSKPNSDSPLSRNDRRLANTDITTYRQGGDTKATLRNLRRASPDLSATVSAYIRTAITTGYTAIAYNRDGTVSPEGTASIAELITRMNIINDYTIGYDDGLSLQSLSEVLCGDMMEDGRMCAELVLDKNRLPLKIQPVSSSQVFLYPSPDGRKIIPKQKMGGDYISLDIPTFFMVSLDMSALDPNPQSPIEAAIQGVLFGSEFMNDLRRVIKRSIHPRLEVIIDAEKLIKQMPIQYTADPDMVNAYHASVIAAIENRISTMSVEDALVHFDSIGVKVLDHGNTGLSQEWTVINEMAQSIMASGAKILPSVLGHGAATSNTASTEAVMFVKFVEGTLWAKLNEMYSSIMTLAARLRGFDVYVIFKYNSIDLRPAGELEAFKALEQSRLLEQNSLGFITDEEVAIKLTGHLPPDGMTPLMGTGYRPNTSLTPATDGANGTATSNDGSTLNQSLNKDKQTGVKSQNQNKTAPANTATVHPLRADI